MILFLKGNNKEPDAHSLGPQHHIGPDVVLHICNPSTQRIGIGGLKVILGCGLNEMSPTAWASKHLLPAEGRRRTPGEP